MDTAVARYRAWKCPLPAHLRRVTAAKGRVRMPTRVGLECLSAAIQLYLVENRIGRRRARIRRNTSNCRAECATSFKKQRKSGRIAVRIGG